MPEATTAQDTALAQVQAYCGWHIAPEKTEELTLDGSGTGSLLLPSLHVVEVLSISENGAELDPATYTWSVSGIVRRAPGWFVNSQPRWTSELRGIVVNLTHGYAAMPLDVQSVVDALAARSTALPPTGLASRTVGPFTESYASSSDLSALGAGDRTALSRYRLPWVAG